MNTPEERKTATLKNLTEFLNSGIYLNLDTKDIQQIKAAIEAAYDLGKNSSDSLAETIKNLDFLIKNGAYKKR